MKMMIISLERSGNPLGYLRVFKLRLQVEDDEFTVSDYDRSAIQLSTHLGGLHSLRGFILSFLIVFAEFYVEENSKT